MAHRETRKEAVPAGFNFVEQVQPDTRGRVSLSKAIKLLEKIKMKHGSFNVYVDQNGSIVLEPLATVPAREAWLYENPKAMAMLRAGIEGAKTQPLVDLGSFAQYADDSDE